MKLDIIQVPSYWGTLLRQKYITIGEDNKQLVVLFPGQNYSCELSLLNYAGKTALRLGYDVFMLEYGYQAARTDFDPDELPRIIEESLLSIQQLLPQYERIVFISKSLGTRVAGEVHSRLQRSVRHVFLTPLVTTLPFINASTDRLVIYGDEDPLFPEDVAAQLEDIHGIHRIPNANHGLETGDVDESLDILRFVVQKYKEFL